MKLSQQKLRRMIKEELEEGGGAAEQFYAQDMRDRADRSYRGEGGSRRRARERRDAAEKEAKKKAADDKLNRIAQVGKTGIALEEGDAEDPGGAIVEFAGGSFKLEYGEVQVHIGADHVADVPFAAILELAEKVAAAEAPEQEPHGEITVTQSQVDALEQADQLLRKRARTGGDLTKLQKQDRRWKLGL